MYILKESEYSLPVYTSNDNDRRKNDLSQNLVIIITAKKLFNKAKAEIFISFKELHVFV